MNKFTDDNEIEDKEINSVSQRLKKINSEGNLYRLKINFKKKKNKILI